MRRGRMEEPAVVWTGSSWLSEVEVEVEVAAAFIFV